MGERTMACLCSGKPQPPQRRWTIWWAAACIRPFVTHCQESFLRLPSHAYLGVLVILRSISGTRAGKLPQQVISKTAAHGYSSYRDQIGLAATYVREYFHPVSLLKTYGARPLSVRLLRKMWSVKNRKKQVVSWFFSVGRSWTWLVRQALLKKFKRLNLLKQLVLSSKRECYPNVGFNVFSVMGKWPSDQEIQMTLVLVVSV